MKNVAFFCAADFSERARLEAGREVPCELHMEWEGVLDDDDDDDDSSARESELEPGPKRVQSCCLST